MTLHVSDFPENFFITGTDTSVGKTLVSAILTLELNASYWKPIQSGLMEETDTAWIQRMTLLPSNRFLQESYRLAAPLSPHESSRQEGVRIDMNQIQIPDCPGRLIVEGAGGVLVPINEKDFMIDLMKKLNLPALIVASSQIGTINHTLLTIRQLLAYELKIFGVVLNGPLNVVNKKAIETYGKIPVIAQIPQIDEIRPSTFRKLFRNHF